MAKIAKNLTELIGNTPLVQLSNYSTNKGLEANVIVKLESFNPAGCVKERIALAMIEDAEAEGILKPGVEIIEPTSGNTGIGLAMVAAVKGYKLTLTMPETMSIERRNLLKALGANLVLTPVPTPATKISTLPSVSFHISGPVVELCTFGFDAFSNC